MSTTTIQNTHKKFKAQSVLSTLTVIMGFWVVVDAAQTFHPAEYGSTLMGILMCLGGSVWYIINRIRIWWNHA